VGPIAIDTLRRFTAETAFLGVSGVTADGISVADVNEGQAKQTVLDLARRVVVPVDSSSFGRTDFFHVTTLDRIDLIITDQASDDFATWARPRPPPWAVSSERGEPSGRRFACRGTHQTSCLWA
jgi:DeoR/GlpR family transcriptional regulator of sugar metabolism